jgi:hypothetical protein
VILGNRHLKALDGGQERLRLFKGDLLDRGSIAAAGAACDGFFHAASSVPPTNPDVSVTTTQIMSN